MGRASRRRAAGGQKTAQLVHQPKPAFQRIGLMGGTFDPVHVGHLRCAQAAMDALGLEKVVFLPAGVPVYKLDQQVTPAEDRVAMLQLALEGHPQFEIDTCEIDRGGKTYTADTLRQLKKDVSFGTELVFIAGADAALTIPQWKESAYIAEEAHIAAITRPGTQVDHGSEACQRLERDFLVTWVEANTPEVSSSQLRQMAACGESLEGLVPSAVAAYIEEKKLYSLGINPSVALRATAPLSGEPMDKPEPKPEPENQHEAETEDNMQSKDSVAEGQRLVAIYQQAVAAKNGVVPGAIVAQFEVKTKKSKKARKAEKKAMKKATKAEKEAKKAKKVKKNTSAKSDKKSKKPADALSKEFYKARKADMKQRVNARRFDHIVGVAQTAKQLAKVYGADPKAARLAGILHDWDKNYDDEGIRQRAAEVGLDIDPMVLREMPQVLHGLTASRALRQQFPEIPEDVLQAVDRHTTGAVDMSDLDMIVFVADCLEPSRRFGRCDELRSLIGKIPLEELYFQVHGYWITLIIARGRTMHPDTITVWNTYALRHAARQAANREAAGLPPRKIDPCAVSERD